MRFFAIFYTFDLKYVSFREPVHELLSSDFVYVFMNRIETNYPVCRHYHFLYGPHTQLKHEIKSLNFDMHD